MAALSNDETACVYSALILADDDIPITAEKMQQLIDAASVKIDSFWVRLYANALSKVNLRDMLTSAGSASSMAAGPGAGPAAGAGDAAAGSEKKEEKEEEKKPEPESESDEDDDMGLGLFD